MNWYAIKLADRVGAITPMNWYAIKLADRVEVPEGGRAERDPARDAVLFFLGAVGSGIQPKPWVALYVRGGLF